MRPAVCMMTLLMLGMLWSCERVDFSETNEPGTSANTSHEDTCYNWNGHVVVSAHWTSGDGLELLLISLSEWGDMPSASHVTDSALVGIVTEGYQEMELSEWRIPTLEEAKRLRAAFGGGSGRFERLNLRLGEVEAAPLSEDGRYLCNEGRKSFSFASGTSISNAGTKAKSYRLRLVKRVLVW